MKNKRQIRKYKKVVSELLYYKAELQFLDETMLQAHLAFEEYYKDYCNRKGIDLLEIQEKNKERIAEITSEKNKFKPKKKDPSIEGKRLLSKIYKSIALELHPDKFVASSYSEGEKKEKEEGFKTAAAAMEENDWGELIEISEDLNLSIEINDILLSEIEKEVWFLKQKIQNDQATYSWALHEAKTVEKKEAVVKDFLKRMFNLELS